MGSRSTSHLNVRWPPPDVAGEEADALTGGPLHRLLEFWDDDDGGATEGDVGALVAEGGTVMPGRAEAERGRGGRESHESQGI